jgi:hypothetical protein
VRIVIEVPAEDFEALEGDDRIVLDGPLEEIEVRQRDGLLNFTRRIVGVVPISGVVAQQQEVAEGGPPLRVFTGPKE